MADDREPFRPSGARAVALDRLMRSRLADSLDHIVERSRGQISFDEAPIAELTARLRGGARVSPDVFAIYYDLVDALLEEREAAGERLMAELAAPGTNGNGLRIVSFTRSELGARTFDRYRRMMDTDPAAPYRFEEPQAETAAAYTAGIGDALDLMARGDHELAGEFRGLVSEILLAKGGSADGLSEFDGGSSFMLWGALFINPSRPKTVVEMVETLAHESAHSLLFGLSIDDPLVENPDGERFKSPLRDDPRPMDGIYHATFVSARMHYAMARLADPGILTADQQAAAREAMESDRRAFRDGLATVEAHGRLTARGMAIMAGARDYMAA